jgi:hypothetical protein
MSEQPVTVNQPPDEKMSLMDKAAGIFYEPSRVFESIKTSGVSFADWFVPLLLVLVLACVASYVQLSSPDLRFQIVQQREAAIDRAVSQGKVTADQADQQRAMIEKTVGAGSTSAIVFSIISITVFIVIAFFVVSLVWMLVGKFALKGPIDYTKAMGITGLSYWIGAVGVIFAIVVSVMMSRIDGGLQLGLLTQMDTQNVTYVLLSKLDLFTIWSLAVTSIGLGTLSGRKGAQPAIWVFGIWVLWGFASFFFFRTIFG